MKNIFLMIFVLSIFSSCEKSETTVNVAPEEEAASNFLKLGDQTVKIIGANQDYSEGLLEFKIFLEGHTSDDDDNLIEFFFLRNNTPPKDATIKLPTTFTQLDISYKEDDYVHATGEVVFKTLDASKNRFMVFSSKLTVLNSGTGNYQDISFNFEGTAPIIKE